MFRLSSAKQIGWLKPFKASQFVTMFIWKPTGIHIQRMVLFFLHLVCIHALLGKPTQTGLWCICCFLLGDTVRLMKHLSEFTLLYWLRSYHTMTLLSLSDTLPSSQLIPALMHIETASADSAAALSHTKHGQIMAAPRLSELLLCQGQNG